MLEVYDCQPGSSHRFPDVCNLCTWDDLGRRGLQRSKSSEAWKQQYWPLPERRRAKDAGNLKVAWMTVAF